MLCRYREALGTTSETRLGVLTAVVAFGYFFVWTIFGMVAYAVGVSLAKITMQQPAVARIIPIAAGVVVVMVGILQFSAWKIHRVACCRTEPERFCLLARDAGAALRYGLRMGLHCCYCCAGFMAILLVMGIMSLRVMTVVTAMITIERLAPAYERVARIIGAVVVAVGLFLIVRAGVLLP